MLIKRICNRNIGPTENIDIKFYRNDNYTPKPIILVGENGTGKSTVLSNIVDAFYEMAGKAYSDVHVKEESGYQYYKSISSTEINIGHEFMFSYIEFCEPDKENTIYQYVFKSGKLSYDEFKEEVKVELQNQNIWKNDQNIKGISASKENIEEIFGGHIFCYFGPDRYEKPIWMGKNYYETKQEDLEHIYIKPRFAGKLETPIFVRDVIEDTLRWLLDVIIDSRTDIIVEDNKLHAVHTDINDVLSLCIARQNIEKVMSEILGKDIYFGLNFRSAHGSRFNIIEKQNDAVIVPTLNSLSTGQSALFNMFATIVRYADNKNINRSIHLDEIEGIVVIDEIELHLHSKLQREVLPKLLKLFPRIQFIITTHSPLFLLGMDEHYGKDGYCIYEMPSAKIITAEYFSEFQNAYTYMTQTEKYSNEIRKAIQNKSQKTLVVTEGATDWRHIKSAWYSFIEKGNYGDLDIDFLEYNPKNSDKTDLVKLDMSGSHLATMCTEFAKVQQARKIIFIADADDKETKKKLSDENGAYKSWGNNVFSFILPIPQHREKTPNICIEHYYTDEDLKTEIQIDGIARRIYMGCEFNDKGISYDKKYICLDRNSCGKGKVNIIDGNSDKKVYEILDDNERNLALPKMEFAEAMLNKKEEMKKISFSEFHLIFDLLAEIEKLPMKTH